MTPFPFAYPMSPHSRRHGPGGYEVYNSYRPWLRDEFSFRCVFCLTREQWGLTKGLWDIDHFVSQRSDPTRTHDYDNLLYVCATCNSMKSHHEVPDPTVVSYGDALRVNRDGTITALNKNGEKLISILRLDNADYTRYRGLLIEMLDILATKKREAYVSWMKYPDDLPNLESLRPPTNTRPDGINDCFFERKARGELSEVY